MMISPILTYNSEIWGVYATSWGVDVTSQLQRIFFLSRGVHVSFLGQCPVGNQWVHFNTTVISNL